MIRAAAAGALALALVAPWVSVAPASGTAPVLVVPVASATFPATWHEAFVVRYGAGRRLLGTSRGGDAGTLRLGPDYGAPAPDGSWWFLDAAKRRLAHYSGAGHYLGQSGSRSAPGPTTGCSSSSPASARTTSPGSWWASRP